MSCENGSVLCVRESVERAYIYSCSMAANPHNQYDDDHHKRVYYWSR